MIWFLDLGWLLLTVCVLSSGCLIAWGDRGFVRPGLFREDVQQTIMLIVLRNTSKQPRNPLE
jgi:hypothetical protein